MLVGITGTKGKSFTAALVHEMAINAGADAVLCGNIGRSPLAVLDKIKKGTIVVAELSSWLLQEFKAARKSPRIAVVTNLMPDHLDKYGNLREYYEDKENIFRFQESGDFLVLNKDDKESKRFAEKAKAKIIWFSGKKGRCAAAIAAADVLGIPRKIIGKTLKNFKGVPHRLELVGEKRGVKYINDSAATTPEAAVFALDSLKRHEGKIILIAGGTDKKLDYEKFARAARKSAKALILLPGSATDKILRENVGGLAPVAARGMGEAVAEAEKLAEEGDVVLLSPGAASFGLFKNEFDRGGRFRAAVKGL